MYDKRPVPAFEEVYPQFAFAQLVSLTLGIAEWVKQCIARCGGSAQETLRRTVRPSQIHKAGY